LRYFESVSGGTYKECGCSFDSFDGGGPEYSAVSDGSGVFTWSAVKDYKSKKHEPIDGAAYGFDFTFWPLRPGEGTCVITGSSPIVPGTKRTVTITVNESLASECTVGEETETDSGPEYDEETEDGAPVCCEETEEDG
ncbi:MAG: hypothetical protein IK047_03740, partial [Clostridia bacterium]|nr:hypothetical protein [Clostridia bacterium]